MLETLPVWLAYLATGLLLFGLLILSLMIPRQHLLEGAPDHAGWRDIRRWTVLLVALQIAIYWTFS